MLERAAVLHMGRLYEFPSIDEAYEFYDQQAVPPPTIQYD
jgi:capsular polysaccharide transport system ATP-binding protein